MGREALVPRVTHSTRTGFPLLFPEQVVAEGSFRDLETFRVYRAPILSPGTTIVPFMLHDPSPSSPPPLETADVLYSLTLFSCGFSQSRHMHQSVVRFAPFLSLLGTGRLRLVLGSGSVAAHYQVQIIVRFLGPTLVVTLRWISQLRYDPPAIRAVGGCAVDFAWGHFTRALQTVKSPSRVGGALLPNDGTDRSVSLALAPSPYDRGCGPPSIVWCAACHIPLCCRSLVLAPNPTLWLYDLMAWWVTGLPALASNPIF